MLIRKIRRTVAIGAVFTGLSFVAVSALFASSQTETEAPEVASLAKPEIPVPPVQKSSAAAPEIERLWDRILRAAAGATRSLSEPFDKVPEPSKTPSVVIKKEVAVAPEAKPVAKAVKKSKPVIVRSLPATDFATPVKTVHVAPAPIPAADRPTPPAAGKLDEVVVIARKSATPTDVLLPIHPAPRIVTDNGNLIAPLPQKKARREAPKQVLPSRYAPKREEPAAKTVASAPKHDVEIKAPQSSRRKVASYTSSGRQSRKVRKFKSSSRTAFAGKASRTKRGGVCNKGS